MSWPTICVIVATSGRSTLSNALESVTPQLLPGDEVIVAMDDSGDAGDTPRNRVMGSARTDLLMFLDDDDELRPDALETVRRFGNEYPDRIGVFRLNYGIDGPRDWREEGNLWNTQTGMYVVPNRPGKLGHWESPPGKPEGRCGDYTFIVETVALQGEPIWRTEVIQEVRPEKSRLKRLRYRVALRTRGRRFLRAALSSSAPFTTSERRR